MKQLVLIFFAALPLAASAGSLEILDSVNCPAYQVETREYEVSRLNPPAQTINGVAFPGNTQVLFRGTLDSNGQFDLEKSLRGLMNEPNWFVGSPLFFGISQVLTGQWTLESSFFPSGGLPLRMRDYFQIRGIAADIETLLSCRAPGKYTRAEAESLASNLMNKVFWNSSSDRIQSDYFNIANPSYYRSSMEEKGLGNNAVDFIIASTYDQVSAIYGKKILVLKDTRNRGLDLGFWNLKHNGRWWDHWVDNGEINIPGYIRSEDLLGFQMRTKDRARSGWGQSQPDNTIDYAFYRADVGGQTVVLMLDGANQLCISEGPDHRYDPCESDDLRKVTEAPGPYPRPSLKAHRRIGLLGVITTCDAAPCTLADDAIKWYGTFSGRKIAPELIAKIEALSVNGKKLKFTASPPAPPSAFTGIKVLSATFLPSAEIASGKKGNVTDAAGAFVNGKDEVYYKVSAKFLGLRADTTEREFRIEWICPQDPSQVRTRHISSPAEGKSFHLRCD